MTQTIIESRGLPRACQWCGEEYTSPHPAKLYCSPKCKNDMGNFFTVVGKRVCADAMVWRKGRGTKGTPADAFQRMCKLLDEANAEFKAERPKRAPGIEGYVEARNGARGVRYGIDR